ncbi:MAG: cytochrome P450, partial [Xenococcaceae cyanobacterium]
NTLTWQRGDRHKESRKNLAQAFQGRVFQTYIDTTQKITDLYLKKWSNHQDLAWYPELKNYSFDVLVKLILGIESASQSDLLLCLESLPSALFAMPLPLPWTKYGRALQSRKNLLKTVEQTIDRHYKENNFESDVLGILIQANAQSKSELKLEELQDQLISLIFLGYKEISSVLTSFCQLMPTHPEIFKQVIAEQKKIGARKSLTLEKIKKMTYLEQVFKEILRLYPPVPAAIRTVIRDCSFNGFRIPKGWSLFYQIDATHRDSEIYDRPDRFDPDRFSSDRAEDKKQPYSYIPFGGGVRECLGKELAILIMKSFASLLVSNYDWELLEPNLEIESFSINGRSNQLKVNFKKLQHSKI